MLLTILLLLPLLAGSLCLIAPARPWLEVTTILSAAAVLVSVVVTRSRRSSTLLESKAVICWCWATRDIRVSGKHSWEVPQINW